MKNVLRIIMLLGALSLAGCKEDQYVSFSVNEIEIGAYEQRITVTVEANCAWTITDGSISTFTERRNGEGTSEIVIFVFSNLDYKSKNHIITVKSEDDSSSDILTIRQEEAKGLEVKKLDTIKSEGGEVSLPIKTNDKITNVNVPEWMTFIESRNLKDYIYVFNATPNKTGSPRTGTIEINGEKTSERIEVKQDSYAPTGIITSQIQGTTTNSYNCFYTPIIPDYSDWSKLSVYCKNGCKTQIIKGTVEVYSDNFGVHTLSFYSNGEWIAEASFEYIPTEIFYKDKMEAFLYQNFQLPLNYKATGYEFKSTDNTVIKVHNDGSATAESLGESRISATFRDISTKEPLQVTVHPFLAYAHPSWTFNLGYNPRKATLTAEISCHKDATLDGYFIVDKDNIVVFAHQNEGDPYSRVINTPKLEFSYEDRKYNNFFEALGEYKFIIQITLHGKTYQRWIEIDPKNISS